MSNATVNVSGVATTEMAASVHICDRGYKVFRFVPTVYKRVNSTAELLQVNSSSTCKKKHRIFTSAGGLWHPHVNLSQIKKKAVHC